MNVKLGLSVVVLAIIAVSCNGEKSFCGCIEDTPADQLEFTGNCAYINDLSQEDFDSEMSKCELEGFELLLM